MRTVYYRPGFIFCKHSHAHGGGGVVPEVHGPKYFKGPLQLYVLNDDCYNKLSLITQI